MNERDWERMWSPYDEATYEQATAWIAPDDVVLDIGAGDLRLARRLAARARRVYAIEIEPTLLTQGQMSAAGGMPANMRLIAGDARVFPFPVDVTAGVLLMRHCRHFHLYARKLQQTGCRTLITNARWRLGVERIDLQQARPPCAHLPYGWYACLCGAVGFIPGPADALTWADLDLIHEVSDCPECRHLRTTT
ncbi:MAG: methyltransferase domain-containing protein [Anaerolineales bacterium]|nr:methyltransferase domain-containing protein [Anaerolineales bacterium]MCB8952751.1 methyltransferase domain-containing protein [Ardenticatenales bacterium]